MQTLISLKFLIYKLSYIFLYLEEIQRMFVFYCVLVMRDVPNILFLSQFHSSRLKLITFTTLSYTTIHPFTKPTILRRTN